MGDFPSWFVFVGDVYMDPMGRFIAGRIQNHNRRNKDFFSEKEID
jgi:hypothetical protein